MLSPGLYRIEHLTLVLYSPFTNTQRLWQLSTTHNDLVWMMPLHEPMRPMIKSQIADLVNAADGSVSVSAPRAHAPAQTAH
jgi:leucyl aminopeptidase